MMSLRPAIPDKKIPQHLPPPSAIAPLVVQFSQNCVPLSCFSRTISCLLALYDWKLSRAQDGSPQCLAHNVVSLFQPQTPGQIVLVDAGHSLQIHMNLEEVTDLKDISEICFQVQETVLTAIKQVFDCLHLTGIEISPAFICPCSSEPSGHPATCYSFKSKHYLRCSVTEQSAGEAQKEYMLLLVPPVTEKDKPSLPKLFKLKVHEKVSKNYAFFGTLLLKDDDGSLVDAIELECHWRCDQMVRRILSMWIRGRGRPATWEALIRTLRECNLSELAKDIHEKTQS
jgi:hypothetical protein